MIYSFEALVKQGGYVDAAAVRLLPVCPDGDINNYYSLLWRKLSPSAKEIIHAIAGTDFHWPLDGIVRTFGQIDEIGFLLETRRIGLVPFHGSILAFVREMATHQGVFNSLVPRILKWLRNDAPPYWKWGWLWLLQSKSGNHGPLLAGANRKWAIDSVTQGWPLEQVEAILKAAEEVAFESGDLTKTVVFRSIKTRISNAEEFQTNEYDYLSLLAVLGSANVQMVDVLADGLTTLAEEDILKLARAASVLKPEICEEARRELEHRVNLWIHLRHRPGDEFVALSKYFIEVTCLCEKIEALKITDFIEKFKDGYPVYERYLECLVQNRRVDALFETYNALKGPKSSAWKADAIDALVRAAASEPVIIVKEIEALAPTELSNFVLAWMHYHKVPTAVRAIAPVRPTQLSDPNPSFRENFTAENYLYETFFYELANGTQATPVPVQSHPRSGEFVDEAINIVAECARNVAAGRSQLSFSTLYYAAKALAPFTDKDFHHPSHSQYFGLKHAMRKISIDMHLIKMPNGKFVPIPDDELSLARTSEHWVEELWIEEQIKRNLPIMSPASAKESLDREVSHLNDTITPFNERADKWVELARLARLYEQPQLQAIVRRAADCAIGYGYRKDLWLNDVLDAISQIHAAGAAQGLPLLRRLVPIVDKITEFTDGDETDHVRSTLIDTTAKINPARLPNFYQHHLEHDDFRYAEEALQEHLKISDFSSPVTRALAHTLLEDADISVLEKIAATSTKAADILAEQNAYLGASPPKPREYTSNTPDPNAGTPPKVALIPPTDFGKILKKSTDHKLGYETQRRSLRDWLSYWEQQGKARIALQAIKDYFESEDRTYDAESLLDHAYAVSRRVEGKKKAYYWLVKAHIHRNGWQSYWTSEKEVMERLTAAATDYKTEWLKFIFDTSVQTKYWRQRNYSFSIGHKYLVRFLILVDQLELAASITRAFVKTVEEEVSDQPIPGAPWFN